nr:uncharacterized protein LOC109754886 [Aegilops tauschii subsp. strangulata]
MVLFATTSQDAWDVLDGSFASQSTARSMAIRGELQDLKKRDLSALVYFNKIKSLADTLTSIGKPLSDEEFTSYVLNGLDSDYDSLIKAVHGRETSIAPRDIYARLLGTEQRIETRRAAEVYHDTSSANAAYRGGSRSNFGARSNNRSTGKPPLLSTPSQ